MSLPSSQARPQPSLPLPERLGVALPLPRLLQRWGLRPEAPPSEHQPLHQQLGDRLAWADAILLSQALAAPTPSIGDADTRRRALDWADAALERVLAELRAGFKDELLDQESSIALPDPPPPLADVLATYRLHLSQQQRLIATRAASLREKLRSQLAGASGSLMRLASLDAVLERALAPQERTAGAGLATLLAQRAEQHEKAHPRQWRAPLWTDLQQLLQAELELRLQPTVGLIEALHQAVLADERAKSAD